MKKKGVIDVGSVDIGKEFVQSIKEKGYVELTGKSVIEMRELASEIKKDFKKFSKLSKKSKMNYLIPETYGDYGFMPISKFQSYFSTLFESYMVWRKLSKDHPQKRLAKIDWFRDNKIIKEFPKLISNCEKLLELMEKLDLNIFQEVSLELGIQKNYFGSRLVYGPYLLRLLYYPKSKTGKKQEGFSQHIDIPLFTTYMDIDEGLILKFKGKKMKYKLKKIQSYTLQDKLLNISLD